MAGLPGHYQVFYEFWGKDKAEDLKSFHIYMRNTLILSLKLAASIFKDF